MPHSTSPALPVGSETSFHARRLATEWFVTAAPARATYRDRDRYSWYCHPDPDPFRNDALYASTTRLGKPYFLFPNQISTGSPPARARRPSHASSSPRPVALRDRVLCTLTAPADHVHHDHLTLAILDHHHDLCHRLQRRHHNLGGEQQCSVRGGRRASGVTSATLRGTREREGGKCMCRN
jgi:hypothetical protein